MRVQGKLLAGVGLVIGAVGCMQIAGIEPGNSRNASDGGGHGGGDASGGHEDSEEISCMTVEDCTVGEPACRIAVACEAGNCVFDDALEGQPLANQLAGDCAELVCDGAGKAKQVLLEDDAPDDENPCTQDVCIGTTPMHTPIPQAETPCATGLPGTCAAGIQYCDVEGNPIGCIAPMPTEERCDAEAADEDCDGDANESGDGCVCGDGFISLLQTGLEECDDGGTASGDGCSATCKAEKVLQVSAGHSHTCATLNGIGIKCWGINNYGQLGLGNTSQYGDAPNEMGSNLAPVVDIGGATDLISIAAGQYHTCVGSYYSFVGCWGRNTYGQLGLGDTSHRGDGPDEMDQLPIVNQLYSVEALVSGANHVCVRSSYGAYCWGNNSYGQIGSGDTSNRGDALNEINNGSYSYSISLGGGVKKIAAGENHTCAVLNNGSVKCWGYNASGQLGIGDTLSRGDGPNEMGSYLPAVDLGTGSIAVDVAAGYSHACALLQSGGIKCWGNNAYGQLGLGDTASRGDAMNEMGDSLPAIDLGTGKYAQAIAAGGGHTCALLTDGSIKCWGFNEHGQLGLGDPLHRGDSIGEMGDSLLPVDLGMGKTAVAISAGYEHTCAVLNDASLKCWGYNNAGQLGLGHTYHRGDEPGEMGDNLPTVKLFSDTL